MKDSNKKFLFKFSITVVFLIVAFTLGKVSTSYTGNKNSKEPHKDKKLEVPNADLTFAEDLMEDFNSTDTENINELSQKFIDENYDFSLEVFKGIYGDKNPVFSPTPVYLALGLISNGTDKEATKEIVSAINKNEIDNANFNLSYKELIKSLIENRGDTDLNIANSIWYDKEFKADNNFLQTNKDYYNSDAYRIDFKDEKAPETINNWLEKVTNGKVDKMIENIDDDVSMYMFSSIYFNSKWEFPFSKAKTFDGEFNTDEGIIETELMSNTMEVKNLITEKEEAILLPYNDDKYEFLALMPKEGLDIRKYIEELNTKDIKNKISQMEKYNINYILPKFEVNYENSLINTLKDLGIERIFDTNSNSLMPMGETTGSLFISDMIQKTYIKVDEEGTEAASVVEAEMETTSLTETINFNQPFMYAIIDSETSLPIFLGIMDNPSKK